MNGEPELTFYQKTKNLVIGHARSHEDPQLFHKLSLVVFFAWVGLGADGLTSSCYGPEEAFLALKGHIFLGIFVALATAITIFVISSSYSQIIELFPAGGGGYLVASKLLSPSVGMISGCALLVDYVLTITLSVASGADALFSFLPPGWATIKLPVAVAVLLILIVLNMRGVKESVAPLIPIFLIFLATHVFAIIYTFVVHFRDFGTVASATISDVRASSSEIGIFGTFVLIMRAYSMGAGTYTGIEAVSNGIPVLREPKVQTAKRTMHYMAGSLAFMVVGLMLGYLLFRVQHQPGKTLNAVLMESITAGWNGHVGYIFVLVTLISEAVLLFVAAQTGFIDGPRILSNMAIDRWIPSRFAILSDRFVTQNGVLMMGGAALILMVFTHGSVKFMVVLYSINVFITFFLSQLGMVRHWWLVRKEYKYWFKKAFVNGVGLALTAFILVSVVVIKFFEGGWITIIITGSLIIVAIIIKRAYTQSLLPLKRLNELVDAAERIHSRTVPGVTDGNVLPKMDPDAKTAVLLVGGYNGLGLHTLFNIPHIFGGSFKNYVFVQVGTIDAANFKGTEEIEKLKLHVSHELDKYVKLMQSQGFYAEGISAIGTDAVEEICETAKKIQEKYPNAVFFGGQMVFPKDTFFSRLLHNYTTFAVQRKFYQQGIPFIIMPVRVELISAL
jgi:amino acid transporter